MKGAKRPSPKKTRSRQRPPRLSKAEITIFDENLELSIYTP